MSSVSHAPTKGSAASRGGGFLIGDSSAGEVLTPEDLSEEQLQVAATADRFVSEEIVPAIDRLEQQEAGLSRCLVRQAGELGLLSVFVPEKYGGLEMEMTTALVVAERMGRYASFSTTYGAHADIGTRPLVLFGTEDQKQRYLPRLAAGEWIGAYCLSEAHAGSDALAARTRAELSEDGRHYLLSGEKMWTSNGGWADLYTVFAKVDGEKFTAFLVERTTPGVRPGAEEKKMGIKGSSTTPLVLDNAAVPAENVLGEIGRGHVIAFNILNIGRLELAASCVGGGKDVLAETIRYAKQRKAFGKTIAEFGLIQQKLAEMAMRLFAAESLVYRTSGLIDARMGEAALETAEGAQETLRAVEEFAIECSIAKVYGSEALDFIVDEGVQIHGGYGFHQDYAVERAYRDSRINRIFEGTNEINRLLTAGMLFKRAAQGRLGLNEAIEAALRDWAAGRGTRVGNSGSLQDERLMVAGAKKIALAVAGIAYQRFGKQLEAEQEVTAALADIVMAVYAAESALLRAEKLASGGRGDQAAAMVGVLVRDSLMTIERLATTVLAASSEGNALQNNLDTLRGLVRPVSLNVVAVRRQIAGRLLEAEKFVM